MENNIIYQGKTKTGQEVVLRFPRVNDVAQLTGYINTISLEKTFIRFQGEQMSLKDETSWLNSQLQEVEQKKAVIIVAELAGQIVGISNINMKSFIESHIGFFGLSVAKDFRGEGIGTLLMSHIIDLAQRNMPQMRIIDLSVFANNPGAITLYEKMGFIEYGRLSEGILHRGEYIDHIYMYKKVLKN